jgi:STIP1 family protein 1
LGKKIKWYKEKDLENQERALILSKLNQIVKTSNHIDGNDTLDRIKNIFEKIEREDKKNKKIPEHLICPVKDDLMDQPVILDPSGFTYEKNEIIKHF